MVKAFIAGISFLCLSAVVALSEFAALPANTEMIAVQAAEYWSTVAAPKTAPAVYQKGFSHNSDYVWRYPYDKPSPKAQIKVSNTIVDSNGKLGVFSLETTLNVDSGWRLWGGAWNQPVVEDASGIAWKLEIVSVDPASDFPGNPYKPGRIAYLYTGFGGSYIQNSLAPVSSHDPYLQTLTEDAWSYYAVSNFPSGGTHTVVAPAPTVIATNIPNKTYQLAYCRVTETGETALSPSYTFTPAALPEGTTAAESSWLTCYIHEFHPQGTIGLHFYRREQITPSTWGDWKRLPDAECYGTPDNPDHWLWPVWKRVVKLQRYIDNAPVHAPVENPQSRLSKLHRLLRGDPTKDKDVLLEYFRGPDKLVPRTTVVGDAVTATGQVDIVPTYDPTHVVVENGVPRVTRTFVGDVIVKSKERFTVYCPVIDEWGNGDSGTTGGPGDQKFHRRVRANDNGEWFIDQQVSQSGHKSWPVVLINNSYSRWSGVSVQAKGGDALSYSDYSGGQAFGNQFRECKFNAPMTAGGRVTCGIRIDHDCAPSHHPSEQLFADCYANGGIGVMIGGNQAANIRFDRLHVNSYSPDPRGSVFYVVDPNPIRLMNGIYCDAYIDGNRGVIFRNSGYPAALQVNDIWCDTGFVRFIESNGVSTQLEMTGGKLNVRGTKPVLGLFAGIVPNKSTWAITGVQTQPDPGTQACRIINHNYRTAEPLLERTGLADLVLKEPFEATATAMIRRHNRDAPNAVVSPREEPGYRVVVEAPVTVKVPTTLTRLRTQAELDTEFAKYSTIPNLPEWGKTFLLNYYLKYVTVSASVKVTTTVKTTSVFNSLTTGKKVTREDLVINP